MDAPSLWVAWAVCPVLPLLDDLGQALHGCLGTGRRSEREGCGLVHTQCPEAGLILRDTLPPAAPSLLTVTSMSRSPSRFLRYTTPVSYPGFVFPGLRQTATVLLSPRPSTPKPLAVLEVPAETSLRCGSPSSLAWWRSPGLGWAPRRLLSVTTTQLVGTSVPPSSCPPNT